MALEGRGMIALGRCMSTDGRGRTPLGRASCVEWFAAEVEALPAILDPRAFSLASTRVASASAAGPALTSSVELTTT